MAQQLKDQATLVAELNDLLQLDHDAVGAYTLAIESIQNESHREQLVRFREDHQRHIRDLTEAIRARAGIPIELPHLPTGAFKLAVQAVGSAGGDREILLAFKSNERQVRDKYRRATEGEHPADVQALLERNASDEEKHYQWVTQTLEGMGVRPTSTLGKAEAAFEQVHARAADAIETVERGAMRGAEQVRRHLGPRSGPIGLGLAALGATLLLRKMLR